VPSKYHQSSKTLPITPSIVMPFIDTSRRIGINLMKTLAQPKTWRI
jgi:hypothetical protein